jgi:hypothetical protein
VQNGFVMRDIPDGHAADGLPPGEGALLACNFWLVNALALIRRGEDRPRLASVFPAHSSRDDHGRCPGHLADRR